MKYNGQAIRQRMRWACRVFSTREEEKLWLEMCRNVPTISYLRMDELAMFYELLMGQRA